MSSEELSKNATWSEYRRLILQELENLDKRLENIEGKSHTQDININTLNVKLSMYAAIGGFIGGLVPTIISLLFSGYFKS